MIDLPKVDGSPGVPSLLLVDDRPSLRFTLGAVFEHAGYAVAEAGCLAEARRLMATRRFDVLVLDLDLNGEHGTDLLPDARRHEPYPVVAVLSGTDFEPVAGVSLALTKSAPTTVILDGIASALNRARR